MPRNRTQLLVYLVVGAVLLVVGLNSVRAGQSDSQSFDPAEKAAAADGEPVAEDGGSAISIGGARKLIVDVSGEVRRPGVYRFDHGSRVIDAIDRAGGSTSNALLTGLNRAALLSDGQQVVVPASAGTVGVAAETATQVGAGEDAPISIGTATQEQLETIDGIGPVTAEKILEYRDSSGGLSSIEDLDQVSGIGPVTMESLRAALTP